MGLAPLTFQILCITASKNDEYGGQNSETAKCFFHDYDSIALVNPSKCRCDLKTFSDIDTPKWLDGRMDGWTGGWMDGLVDG